MDALCGGGRRQKEAVVGGLVTIRKKMPAAMPARWSSEELLRPSQVGLAVADVVGGGIDRDDDGAVGVGRAAGIGVVGEEILGSEFAVDSIEDGAQFLRTVGIEHGAAGRDGHRFHGGF